MPRKDKGAYNEYMKKYMREYRAYERQIIRAAKKQFGKNAFKTPKQRKKRRKK